MTLCATLPVFFHSTTCPAVNVVVSGMNLSWSPSDTVWAAVWPLTFCPGTAGADAVDDVAWATGPADAATVGTGAAATAEASGARRLTRSLLLTPLSTSTISTTDPDLGTAISVAASPLCTNAGPRFEPAPSRSAASVVLGTTVTTSRAPSGEV